MGSSIITLGIGPRAIHRSPAFQSDQLNEKNVIIIGGGPSGLTAALDLVDANVPVAVLERNAIVGGIARTETYKGFHFDMGGHRCMDVGDGSDVETSTDQHGPTTSLLPRSS